MAERSVNKAILVGRLGADAETRFTQNGTAVSRVSLAMNRQWTDSDNQVHEETDWMSIVIWKKENLATYLTKGTKLYVEGRLQTRSYDDKEGVKRYVTEVVADRIYLYDTVIVKRGQRQCFYVPVRTPLGKAIHAELVQPLARIGITCRRIGHQPARDVISHGDRRHHRVAHHG